MTSAVQNLLSALVRGKKQEDHVFTRDNGKAVRDFRGTWKQACSHAGAPDLLFHDLRRTGARNMRRAGIAEGVIMKIGGWRTRSVFERYAIVSRSDMADAILKLQECETRIAKEQEEKAEELRRSAQSGHNEAVGISLATSQVVN